MPESDAAADGSAKGWGARSFWLRELPYLAIIVLGLIGVSWTESSRTPSTTYWEIVTPITALICIAAGWSGVASGGERFRIVAGQALHWAAVLIAMALILVSAARPLLDSDATGLILLTLLALGVFTAGVSLWAWRLCVAGALLAVSVPMVAWVQRAALLLLFVGAVVAALAALLVWLHKRNS